MEQVGDGVVMGRAGGVVRLLHRTLGELRRRHVTRVAIAYCAGAWLVLQVATAIFPIFAVPEAPIRILTAVLLLGLPVAVGLSWAYDLTAAGVQRAAAVTAPGVESPAVAIVALPFVDRGAAAEHQYLGDGIADELISALARVRGLRVVARTSAFVFRDRTADARQVGQRLNVSYLVDGSIAVIGDRLRVHAQLIDTGNGYAQWSGTFDRALGDVMTLSEDVARAVLRALRPHLPPAALAMTPAAPATAHPAAYDRYLRGRALWNERTPAALHRAIAEFGAAIRHDSGFALAHAGLADAHAILVDHAIVAPAESLPAARAAAARALALAPYYAEAHASAALVRQMDGDRAGAEHELRAALELDAGCNVARHRLALLLAWTGRVADARVEIGRALDVDPLSPLLATAHGWIEYYGRRFDAACDILERTLHAHPAFTAAHVPLALARIAAGDAAAALPAVESHLALVGRTAPALSLRVLALGRAGRHAEARAALAELLRLEENRWVPPWYLAVGALGVSDRELVLRFLRRSVTERAPQLIYLACDPLFDALRADPELTELFRASAPSSA